MKRNLIQKVIDTPKKIAIVGALATTLLLPGCYTSNNTTQNQAPNPAAAQALQEQGYEALHGTHWKATHIINFFTER